MRATEFEFRHRFWIITACFVLAVVSGAVDHTLLANTLLTWLSRATGRALTTVSGFRALFGVAALIGIAGGLVRTWAAAYLRASVVHDSRLHSDVLVADGPYRHMRNPLYLGTFLLGVSIGFLLSRLGFVVLVVGLFVFTLRLIGREEAELSSSQDEDYRHYCKRVPRLIPSILPRVSPAGGTPHWVQGILGESGIWTISAGVAALAITLRPFWIYLFVGLSFPLAFALNALLRQRDLRAKAPAHPE
jgi:protein-S-isoprenylcysteine O-methyltransferase Ste14